MLDPQDRFSNELDDLIFKWMDKPLDDRLSTGDYVSRLMFKAHNLMADARDDWQEKEASEEGEG